LQSEVGKTEDLPGNPWYTLLFSFSYLWNGFFGRICIPQQIFDRDHRRASCSKITVNRLSKHI
jgi:hypothetical protein